MVIRLSSIRQRQAERGTLLMEVIIALGLLATVVIPLGFSIAYEQKLCRAYYFEAIAMEIIDGEMEVLKAGEWKAYANGSQSYPVAAASAKNLPPGRFVLTVNPASLRLEWIPQKRGKGGIVAREASLARADK